MTDDSALAALAVRVTALKGNLSKLRGDLDAARHEFANQLAEVAAQLEDLAAREGKSLAAIYWPGLDEAARSAALEVLSAWVEPDEAVAPGLLRGGGRVLVRPSGGGRRAVQCHG